MDDGMNLPDDPFAKDQKKDDPTLLKLVRYVEQCEEATQQSRLKAERDRDFYDGIQWTDEEIADMEERRQPVVTYNRIARKVNVMRGTEVRTRTDPSGLPRTPQHGQDSEAVTDALRFVGDHNDYPRVKGEAFDNLAVEGLCAAIVDTESEGDDEVSIKIRGIPFDRFIYDPHSRKPDFTDSKFKGLLTWYNVDDAIEEYANRTQDEAERSRITGIIKNSAATSAMTENADTYDDRPKQRWYDHGRKRIAVVELYFRQMDERLGLVWHVAHFTKHAFLVEPRVVAYTDTKGVPQCPVVATSAFVNRENERYGVVRHMIDPQKELNKRRSKALHYLNVAQIIMEEGAVEDVETVRSEIARPDGVVVIRDREALFEVNRMLELAQGHVQMMQDAKAEIDTIGPDAALAAADQRALSGVAIQRRQQQGTMELEPLFDHMRAWQKSIFEQAWYRIRQFWTYQKWMRLRDSEQREGYRFVALNRRMTRGERMRELAQKGMPIEETFGATGWHMGVQMYMQAAQAVQQEAQAAAQAGVQVQPQQLKAMALEMVLQQPMAQEVMTENDISQLDVDILIDETPDTTIMAEDQLNALARLAENGLGQFIPPEVIIESMPHLRDKRRIMEKVEQASQPDQGAQQAQQIQVEQLMAEIEKTKAEVAEHLAKVEHLNADTQKTQAEAVKLAAETGTTLGRLDAEMNSPAAL